jgi:hypothetical protein
MFAWKNQYTNGLRSAVSIGLTPTARMKTPSLWIHKEQLYTLGCTTESLLHETLRSPTSSEASHPAELIQDALPWAHAENSTHGSSVTDREPAYFEGLIAEIRERPIPADYREYLRKKFEQLRSAWARTSADLLKKEGCLDMHRCEIVQ